MSAAPYQDSLYSYLFVSFQKQSFIQKKLWSNRPINFKLDMKIPNFKNVSMSITRISYLMMYLNQTICIIYVQSLYTC